MYQNCIQQTDKMESTVKEILDVLGGHIEVDTVLDYIQNDPNYGNNNLSIKQVNEYAQRLALKSSNSKLFMKKYEELKCKDPKNLIDLFTLIYKLSSEERKSSSKSGKPRVAPKPVLGDSKYFIIKDDLPQIKEKLLKAVDESKKLVMKSFEDKESKLKPNIYNSLDIPDWFKDFPTMSWDFPKECLPISHGLAGIPVESQESIIVNELLYIFSGIPANYIVHQPVETVYEPRKFIISDDLDSSLRQMVEPMLQLASHYSIVRRFIESATMSSGQVIHALVAAVEVLLKDYYILLAQLESEHMAGGLSLYKLWYFIVPTAHSMQTLASILTSIAEKNLKGGEVISILHTKTNSLMGDMKAQEIAFFLTERACQPYLKILHKWIHKGSIEDPFQEFMIEDNEIVNKDELPIEYSDDYWEKRYSLQIDRVPKFLEDYTDKILRTGKYLNVISQCGKNIQNTDSVEMKYAMRENNCGAVISNAYTFASTSLLELLLNEYDLMGRLKSVKNYFLINQGDFIVQFMDATEQELSKKIDDIIPSKLESLLGLCLKLSAAKHDPYSEDMRVELLPYDLQYQMCKIQSIETDEEKEYRQKKESIPLTGIESFSFGVEVKWPVSLVLNHKAISCYQMIFRHLFYCKHVERLLCRVWLYNKVVKRFAEGRLYAEAFALRQRMLSCIQHLQYYMCVEVIEPSWTQLILNLKKVDNVDEVIERHSDFYETCLADCMLTDSKLLRTVTALCLVCVQFCSFIQNTACGSNPQPIEPDSFSNKVNRFGQRFTAALLSLLGIIDDKDNNTKKLLNISARLRFNTYYEKEIESFLLQYKQMDGDKNNI